MVRIAVTSTSFCKSHQLREHAKRRLAGLEVCFADPSRAMTRAELEKFLSGAKGLLVGREIIDRSLLASLPELEAIAVYGVGYDNIDLDACQEQGVALYVEHGVNADAVAEHTIGMMIGLLRNIVDNNCRLRHGQWNKNGGRQLSGRTVAVIGCGHVGTKVARLLRGFSCPLILTDIEDRSHLARELGGRLAPLDEALAHADVVTLHVPLTPLTKGMINATTLALMKRDAVLVNTSRGPVVNLQALKNSLDKQELAGAALDVFETEPIFDDKLIGRPQVVATPHTAGNAVEAVWAMGSAAVEHLASHFH